MSITSKFDGLTRRFGAETICVQHNTEDEERTIEITLLHRGAVSMWISLSPNVAKDLAHSILARANSLEPDDARSLEACRARFDRGPFCGAPPIPGSEGQ